MAESPMRIKTICRAGWALLAAVWCLPGYASLTADITVSKTLIAEGAPLTVIFNVTNTGSTTEPAIIPSPYRLTQIGFGQAILLKVPTPTTFTLKPGESKKFTYKFKAALAGDLMFQGRAYGYELSQYASSPVVTITPKKVGSSAVTNSEGVATLKVGNAKVPISMQDPNTGSPIPGLVLGVSSSEPASATVAVFDPQSRNPTQFLTLWGPPASEGVSLSSKAAVTAPPVLYAAAKSNCGEVDLFRQISIPLTVSQMPKRPAAPEPPNPAVVPKDPSKATMEALRNALNNQHVKDFLSTANASFGVTRDTVECDQALSESLGALAPNAQDTLISPVKDWAFENLGNQLVRGAYQASGTTDKVLGVYNGVTDLWHCAQSNPDNRYVVSKYTLAPDLFGGYVFHYPYLFEPNDDSPADLANLGTSILDPEGQPIGGGSLELFRKGNAGFGYGGAADSGDSFDLPGGDYDACVRAPGFQPKMVQVSVPGTLSTSLVKNLIASGTFPGGSNPLTGFLPEGTQVQLTPEFRDAAGNVVICPGTAPGNILWNHHNPVGSTVATVSPTGLVTVGAACGAARITAFCVAANVNTSSKLVSSDCKSKQPP